MQMRSRRRQRRAGWRLQWQRPTEPASMWVKKTGEMWQAIAGRTFETPIASRAAAADTVVAHKRWRHHKGEAMVGGGQGLAARRTCSKTASRMPNFAVAQCNADLPEVPLIKIKMLRS